ncbi:MAG: uracil-DNA glycosylase [Flavobacteriales bacterium]
MMNKQVAPKIAEPWKNLLKKSFSAPYFANLKEYLLEEKKHNVVYPPGNQVFAAFEHTMPEDVKVVIVGQDPYHGPGQANGLCFSVAKGMKLPPSLQNIFKELCDDLGCSYPSHGDLSSWARQGVLLLNTTLTVRSSSPGSHFGKGWETFTDEVIVQLTSNYSGIVFLLWGKPAQKKEASIAEGRHFVLKAPHPSPFSAHTGFLGCKHFSKCNEHLVRQGKTPINWCDI